MSHRHLSSPSYSEFMFAGPQEGLKYVSKSGHTVSAYTPEDERNGRLVNSLVSKLLLDGGTIIRVQNGILLLAFPYRYRLN